MALTRLADGSPTTKAVQTLKAPAVAKAPAPAMLSPSSAMQLLNPTTGLRGPLSPDGVPSAPTVPPAPAAARATIAPPATAPLPAADQPAAYKPIIDTNTAPATPPAAAPPVTAPPASAISGGGGPSQADIAALINSNPALAQQNLANDRNTTSAAAAEASAIKQLLLGYGSQTLARTVLASLASSDPKLKSAIGDIDSFVGATDAKGNPLLSEDPDKSTSVLGQLARAYRANARSQDESFNSRGLFFSGARVGALDDLTYQSQVDAANARNALEQALTGAAGGYTGAQQTAEEAYIAAYQNAYQNALDEALKYPSAGGDDTPAPKLPTGGPNANAHQAYGPAQALAPELVPTLTDQAKKKAAAAVKGATAGGRPRVKV